MAHHSTRQYDVSVVSTETELLQACAVRAEAYGHHLGAAVLSFSAVEDMDREAGTFVLLCRDSISGAVLGTARIQTNEHRPLLVERSVILPRHIARRTRAEVTRLAVKPGSDRLVKLSLMRAVYQFCEAQGIDWLVICARSEPLARTYRSLGFVDFLEPGQHVLLAHAGHLPHLVFTMDVAATRQRWLAAGHRLQSFMLECAQGPWLGYLQRLRPMGCQEQAA
ncbi:MAG TPA: hypothetical protein VFM33_00080 [Aquabacterium sp.]|nr:hypothetical protein [Aquabacterium sp.]